MRLTLPGGGPTFLVIPLHGPIRDPAVLDQRPALKTEQASRMTDSRAVRRLLLPLRDAFFGHSDDLDHVVTGKFERHGAELSGRVVVEDQLAA